MAKFDILFCNATSFLSDLMPAVSSLFHICQTQLNVLFLGYLLGLFPSHLRYNAPLSVLILYIPFLGVGNIVWAIAHE
jgi:hypothetical protein